MPSGGSSGGGGGGGGGGQLATSIVSSVANIGAGHFADRQLSKGTNAAIRSQREANALYRGLYDDTQADYQPFIEGGQSAFDALLRTYGLAEGQDGQADFSGFESSPDYKFALEQGQQALDRSAASRGRLYSGAQMKESQRFGQGLATQNLGTYRGGLQNIASGGLGATNALSNYRLNYGNQLGTGITNVGDLQLARRLGRADINYRNVAAQDQIWGAYSGGQSSYGGGNALSQGYNPQQTTGPGTSSYNFNPWSGG